MPVRRKRNGPVLFVGMNNKGGMSWSGCHDVSQKPPWKQSPRRKVTYIAQPWIIWMNFSLFHVVFMLYSHSGVRNNLYTSYQFNPLRQWVSDWLNCSELPDKSFEIFVGHQQSPPSIVTFLGFTIRPFYLLIRVEERIWQQRIGAK